MKGVIIKQSDFGEGHRMLWIFTDEHGIIKAVSHGARRTKSKNSASSQFLSYAEFDIYTGGEIWNINNIESIDSFFPIQEDIEKLALCTYFADITYLFMDLNNSDVQVLRLLLNTLYACAYTKISIDIIKPVFELKLMSLCGYMPSLSCCILCGRDDDLSYFNIEEGGVVCSVCSTSNIKKISSSAYKAMNYIVTSDIKKIFSFTLDDASLKQLYDICESYIMVHTDKNVKSLDYLKKIKIK